MTIQLGEAFRRPLPVEPDRMETLMLTVLSAISSLQISLSQLPTPQITIDPPDLTDIVTAVQNIRGGPTEVSAEDIAQAVVGALHIPQPQPVDNTVQESLVKALEKLEFRMQGIGAGGVGGTVATISNDVAVKPAAGTTAFPVSVTSGTITATVADARTLTERMFARAPQSGYSLYLDTADATYIYIAEAASGTATTAASFQGVRVSKDASGNPLGGVAVATGFAWDSRSSASWAV